MPDLNHGDFDRECCAHCDSSYEWCGDNYGLFYLYPDGVRRGLKQDPDECLKYTAITWACNVIQATHAFLERGEISDG